MPRVPKSIKSTRQILKGSNHILQSLLAQSRELISIQEILDHFVDGDCAAASLKNKELVIATPLATQASQLRYRQKKLLSVLRRQGLDVESIRIKVAPVIEKPAPPVFDRDLSKVGARQLLDTAQDIEDTSLKTALERLARHASSDD